MSGTIDCPRCGEDNQYTDETEFNCWMCGELLFTPTDSEEE